MYALISVFGIVILSLLVTRIATIAFMVTGLSRESARFQARSARTGTGFTTTESESVVDHPVRRRIVMRLMLLGGAGIVAGVSSLILSFRAGTADDRLIRAGVLIGGLFVLWWLSRLSWVDRQLSRGIAKVMRARGWDVRDYARLLNLVGDYTVSELKIRGSDWVAGRALGEMRLRDEGLIVLGVHRRNGPYVGTPGPETVIEAGDTLVLYGRHQRICELDDRRRDHTGERAREEAVEEQQELEREDERAAR